MPYERTSIIEPGDVSSAANDDALLDAVEAMAPDALNLRTEAVALPHFAAKAVCTWDDQVTALPPFVQVVTSATPVQLTIGGTDIKLTPVAGARATLEPGDVLRWHLRFTCEDNDATGNRANDLYFAALYIDGTDANGAHTKSAADGAEYGLVGCWSICQGTVDTAPPGPAVKEIKDQPLALSGIYIHDTNTFSASGGALHIDLLRIKVWVQDALNSVTLTRASFSAMILKG